MNPTETESQNPSQHRPETESQNHSQRPSPTYESENDSHTCDYKRSTLPARPTGDPPAVDLPPGRPDAQVVALRVNRLVHRRHTRLLSLAIQADVYRRLVVERV